MKKKLNTRRTRLFNKDPHCHWCGKETTLKTCLSGLLPLSATVDHVKCKQQCLTRKEYNAVKNKVLACHRCNGQRNDDFLKTDEAKIKPTWMTSRQTDRSRTFAIARKKNPLPPESKYFRKYGVLAKITPTNEQMAASRVSAAFKY
jgi:hypothetical protein